MGMFQSVNPISRHWVDPEFESLYFDEKQFVMRTGKAMSSKEYGERLKSYKEKLKSKTKSV